MSSGSAAPKQVISMPKVKGLKAIKPQIHIIYPINSGGTVAKEWLNKACSAAKMMLSANCRWFQKIC